MWPTDPAGEAATAARRTRWARHGMGHCAWGAALLLSALALAGAGEARDLIRIGGDGGRSWRTGGDGIDPVVILGDQEVTNENTPGGVVDFASRAGWIYPESADRTENIALGSQARGGGITAPSVLEELAGELVKMVDNDANTAFERKSIEGRAVKALGVVMQLDLGARFGVSRIRFFPRNAAADFPAPDFPFQDDFLKAFEIFLNDGTKGTLAAGLPVFTSILLETQNDQPVVDVQVEPQYVRFLQVKSQTTVAFEIAELQVFGEGFVPTADYHSDIFDMGTDLGLWGSLRWQEDTIGDPIRSRANISTRTGLDESPVVFHRIRSDGQEVPWKAAEALTSGSRGRDLVTALDAPGLDIREARSVYADLTLAEKSEILLTQADHGKLKAADRGGVNDDLENWSTWSPPYSEAGRVDAPQVAAGEGGVRILSPGPRRYFQFKVEYTSEDLFSARGIGDLAFDFTSPSLAEEVLAEIQPRQAELGQSTDFSLVVVPQMRPGVDRGFDAVVVSTPVRVSRIERIEMSLPDGSKQAQDFSGADLGALPVTLGDFRIDAVEDDHFQIAFPRVERSALQGGQVTALKVDFGCVVLRTGTEFAVQALLENAGEVPQRAVAGNALLLSGGGSSVVRNPGNLVVLVDKKGGLLMNVGAVPPVFSPNGDGVNDATRIDFDVTDLTSGADVDLQIYDLSGRLLRVVDTGSYGSGRYARTWDGTDDGGNTVSPGLYLYRIRVDADAGSAQTSGTVAVVY